MKQFYEKNKVPIAIVIAGIIVAAAVWLSNKQSSVNPENRPSSRQSQAPAESVRQASIRISYTQAPDCIGKYACVTGKVDHVFTSRKGTIFINFCADYKTCPFGCVIFGSNASKFPYPQEYTGKNVEITGFITAYQERPEIVIESPAQIRITQ